MARTLKVGDRAQIYGVVSEKERHLNLRRGTILFIYPDSWCEIRLDIAPSSVYTVHSSLLKRLTKKRAPKTSLGLWSSFFYSPTFI